MIKVIEIDSNGLYVTDVLLQDGEEVPTNCIATQCSPGFYLPMWNGTSWVEGMAPNAITTITTVPVPQTQIQILVNLLVTHAILTQAQATNILATLQP